MQTRYRQAAERTVQMLQAGVKRGQFEPLVPLDTAARMFISLKGGIMADAAQFGADGARTDAQIVAFKETFKHLLGLREAGVGE
ncbi:hypothetical protein [Cohnella sp. 56]|uniref:hypothetical protein n=1 Tax=Cohnella sp. 56 TaxID=3113722 RepID=UPI0030EA7ED6